MITQLWKHPATIQQNNFKFKSLSNWSYNNAVGCGHRCRFCYVPEVSVNRMAGILKPLGVDDPDAQWGDYVFPRPFDENAFRASLRRALREDASGKLPRDGNRAIMFCTTTDAYQTLPDKAANEAIRESVQKALEIILAESDLNVRILTRSPLASRDFELMAKFGPRLTFGMSLPTVDNRLASIYEPGAPAPTQRLRTLKLAKECGLHVFVAVAPTYPEMGGPGFEALFDELAIIKPITIFAEPINIRAENVERIAAHAKELEVKIKSEVFATPEAWAQYARGQLEAVEAVAADYDLSDRLHLWPDATLPGKFKGDEKFAQWCKRWWDRVSEWPAR